ncbi:MAG: InlB B-repeat-containing protein [Oscillospiraceae bacterium]|nr:InlB B-repeat-containing protein [Oscillospiraceae bacterium]
MRDGYVFAGWTLNGEVVTSITVSGDTTVRAKWKTTPYAPASVYWNGYKAAWSAVKGASKYEVTLFRDGVQYGSVLQAAETRLDLQSVLSAQRGAEWTFKAAAIVPDEDGGQEVLWPYSDVSAAWVPVYTVTYDAGLGMFKDGSSSRFGTSHAGLYTLFGEEPAWEGYFFEGWSLDGIRVTAIQVTDDVSVSAVWKLDDTVYPVSVALNEAALSLTVGATAELTAEVLPEDATDPSVTWTSSDPSVATVEDGHVTAVSYGTAVITAVSSNGLTAECQVSVTPVPAYLVAPKTIFMSGSTMVWSPVKNAVRYRIELYLNDALYGTYETEGEAYYNGRLSFSTPVTSDSGTRVLKFRVQAVAYDETYNSAYSAFSEEETIRNTLAKPTGLNFDGVTLSWDPVEHAEYYEVCCQNYYGNGVYTDDIYGTSIPYTSLNATARNSYHEYFTVTAYAKGYNNSSASERFNISNITPQASDVYAPYNTRFVDGTYGKFSFGYDNPDAWYYVRVVNRATGAQAGKTLHLTCEAATRAEVSVLDLVSGLGEGDYWISISAALNESAAPGSEITSIAVPWHYTPNAYKLPAPTNLRYMPVDGEICIVWDPVPNASYYKYQGYRDDVRRGYGSTTSYQDYGDFIAMPYFSNPDSIPAGSYTFECCAVGDNETTVDSDYSARSAVYTGTPFEEVTILYDAGEGEFQDGNATRSVTALEGYVSPINDVPVRVGYTFAGWTLNGAPFASYAEIHADTTVAAAWEPIDIFYDVTYDAAGGTLNGQASVSVQAAAGRYVLTDAVPVRDGYVFDGWMMDGVLLESDVVELEGPEVITAKWIRAVEPVDGTLVFTVNPAAVRTVENNIVSFHAEVGIDTGDGVVPLPSGGVRFRWQYKPSSSYSWFDIPGAYDDTYSVIAQYGMDERSYRAIASFDNRQAESAAAKLEVDKVLTIVTDLPETVEVREWEEVSLIVDANSWTDSYSLIRIAPDGTETVLLQNNGSGPWYDFRARLADDGSRYYVLFRLGDQEVRSTVTTLTVNALTERPTSVTISPNKTKLYYSNQNETSDTLIITSSVTGVSDPENLVYVWQVSYDRNDWQSLSASESEDPSVYQMDVMGGSTEYYRLVVNGVASDFVKIQIINRDDSPDTFTYRDILFHGNGGVFPNEAETWYDTTPADVGTYYISTTGSWAIPEPAREGYRFLGWTLAGSDQLVTKATVGSSTIHFYAKWEEAPEGIAITSALFPDENFRDNVAQLYDTDANGYLSTEEIAEITSIRMSDAGIGSLRGIQYFTSLTSLTCDGNGITDLSVLSGLPITVLDCSANPGIDLSGISGLPLTELYCSDCGLTALDVSSFGDLEILGCRGNSLTELNLLQNPSLRSLVCQDNAMTGLDLSGSPLLAGAVNTAAPETRTGGSGREYTIYDLENKHLEVDAETVITGVPFVITYDANGGTLTADGEQFQHGTVEQYDVVYASGMGEVVFGAEKEGSVFNGWMMPDGSVVNEGDSFPVAESLTLTAQWEVQSSDEIILGWRWADMENGVAVRRTENMPDFVVQMMPGSYCVGEFLYGTADNLTQVDFADLTVDGEILELRRNLNDGCVELYITGYGDCTLTYEGVEMMIISRIPDVAFYTSSTNVGQDTYIMSPWNYDGSVKTVYLVATNGASLNSVTNRCGNDLTITLAQDGSYAEISWTGLNNNWIEVQAAGTWGNGAAFDNSYHVQLNDQAQHLYWKSGTISYETGEETFTPDESPLMKEITVPSNSTLIGFVTYGTPGVSMETVSYSDLTVEDENGILILDYQGENFVQLHVSGTGTATLSYMGETVTIHSTLPDIAFYTAPTASEEYYLPQSQIWAYTDQNRTIYLIAQNGAVMTDVRDLFAEITASGSSGLDISLSADGTVATIQLNSLFDSSQIVLGISGTNANGETLEDYTFGISVRNASPALYFQRALVSGEDGGEESLQWYSYFDTVAHLSEGESYLGRFVYGTAENGSFTDSMTVVAFDQLTQSGDEILAAQDHGDYLELSVIGYGTVTLSYNGSSFTIDNTLMVDENSFPDANFRSYILNNIDTNDDGYLSDGEISPVTTMELNGMGIATLQGIHVFRNLITLQCAGNSGIDLTDINGLPLENLMCHACGLQGINLSGMSRLRRFECNGSAFASLDVSQNPDLFKLVCRSEQLVTVYLNSNSALWNLATGTTPQIVTPEQGPQYIQYSGEGETLLEIGTTTTLSGVVIVTYDANGGQFTDGSGDTVKMRSAASGNYLVEYQFDDVSREGYAFTGWYLPEGAEVGPDDVITADGYVTLTAHWSPRPTGVVVTADYFDGDDDDTVYISTDPESGATLTLYSEIQGVSNEDYDGMTWIWEESRDLTEWYEVMLEADDMADLTSFHYHPQTNAVETVYYRETVNGVSSNVVTVSYYTNGSGMPTETYTVSYSGEGGEFEEGVYSWSESVPAGDYMISDLMPTRAGFNFTGWLMPDGTTVVYAGDMIQLTDHLELAARWEQIDLDNDQEISMDSVLTADSMLKEETIEPVQVTEIEEEPVNEETVNEEPIVEEPVYEEPVYEEPVYEEPVYEEPAYEEPVYEEPVYEEPVYEEPAE